MSKTFHSPAGRKFHLEAFVEAPGANSLRAAITMGGKEVGTIFKSTDPRDATRPYNASMAKLTWAVPGYTSAPMREQQGGYDSGPVAELDDALAAYGRSADHILNWGEAHGVGPTSGSSRTETVAQEVARHRAVERLAYPGAEALRTVEPPRLKEPPGVARLVVGRTYWTKIGSDWQKVVLRQKVHERVPGSDKIRWGLRISREGDERILPKLRTARSLHEEIPKQIFEAHAPLPPSEPKTAAGREIAQQKNTYDAATARRLAKALDLDHFAETRLTFDKALRDRIASLQVVKASRSEILAVVRGAMRGANRGRCEALLQELASQAMKAGASNMPPLTAAEIAPRARDIGCPPDVAEAYYERGYRAGQKRARLGGRATGSLFEKRAPSPQPQAPHADEKYRVLSGKHANKILHRETSPTHHHHEGGVHHLSVKLDARESVVVASMREASQAVAEFLQRGGRPSPGFGEVRDEHDQIVGHVKPHLFRPSPEPRSLPAARGNRRGRKAAPGPKRGRDKCTPHARGCVLVREYWRHGKGKTGGAGKGVYKVIIAEGGGTFGSEKVFRDRAQALQHRDILRAGGVAAKVIDTRGNEVG